MQKDELDVVTTLGDAWNKFLKLPSMHSADRAEFCAAIHQAQNIVLARAGLREIQNDGPSEEVLLDLMVDKVEALEVVSRMEVAEGELNHWIMDERFPGFEFCICHCRKVIGVRQDRQITLTLHCLEKHDGRVAWAESRLDRFVADLIEAQIIGETNLPANPEFITAALKKK